jgi:two-component system, NarL family, nitrate/nitrite response regulator NarL
MARILLADSQPLFNEALKALLTHDAEHEVVGHTSSAHEVLSLAERCQPDLVLVDAAIGLGGSPSLVTRLVQAGTGVKVLVLGNDQDVDLLLAAIRAGAAGVIGKTYSAALVLRVTRLVLAGEAVVPRAAQLPLLRRLTAAQHAEDSPLSRLSERERQVLARFSRGWDNARIGRDLYISQHTVRTHIQNILEKLGMHSKLEAATFAMQQALELAPVGAEES